MNTGLITARGGSKGLPRKNVLDLAGLPLIAWTINAALKSTNIDNVFVSTEDQEIANISLEFGAKLINRPIALAQDNTSSESVIQHAIDNLQTQDIKFENICLLQPTSPLRTAINIDDAYQELINKNANCVISVFEPVHSAAKSYKLSVDGSLTGLLFDDAPYCRRQDLPVTYQPNGAIYWFTKAAFLINSQIPRTNVFPYLMTEEQSADIDSLADLQRVELIIKRESK